MNLTNCPYVSGHELIKDNILTVFNATHSGLGKQASIWVYQLATDSMAEVTEHFHRQFSLAGAAYHPDVASIYMGGVEGQYVFTVQEPLLHTSLASVVAQSQPRDCESFYQTFIPLLQMLRTASRLSLSFERVRLADIMVVTPGRYRVQRWNPLSSLDRASLPSELAAKIADLPGLFYCEDVFDFDRNSKAIAHWGYESVSAGGRSLETAVSDFQAAMKDKRKKNEPLPRFIAEVDPAIERFIYKLFTPQIQGGYNGIDDVIVALERVRRGDNTEEWPQPSSAVASSASAVKLFSEGAVAHQPVSKSTFSMPDYSAAVRSKQRLQGKYSKLLLVILAVVIVFTGAYFAFLTLVQNNKAPTAEIVLLKTRATTHEKVIFDGSRSSDPDGDVLQYHWNVVEPLNASTHFFISRNRNPSAVNTTIQFFRPGTYKISLYVSDGTHTSPLEYATIIITE